MANGVTKKRSGKPERWEQTVEVAYGLSMHEVMTAAKGAAATKGRPTK